MAISFPIVIAVRLFQRQPALMPTVRAAAKNSDILETGSPQLCCGTRRAPVSLADHHDRLFASSQIEGSVSQLGKGYINGARQMPGRRSELIGLADIEQHDLIARCELA